MWTKLWHALFVGGACGVLAQWVYVFVSLLQYEGKTDGMRWILSGAVFVTSAMVYLLLVRRKPVEEGVLWQSRKTITLGSSKITLWVFILVAFGLCLGLSWWFLAS